ncbi:hypothetical protein HDV57DRAFT_3797 [Trichoderma longibrachiatum]
MRSSDCWVSWVLVPCGPWSGFFSSFARLRSASCQEIWRTAGPGFPFLSCPSLPFPFFLHLVLILRSVTDRFSERRLGVVDDEHALWAGFVEMWLPDFFLLIFLSR